MAKREMHSKAIELRMSGYSYSQIRQELSVSKGTLSIWLKDYPLSEQRIRELRDNSAQRIERYRETRCRTRKARWARVRSIVASDIGVLNNRELILAGIFLYWGEGGKTKSSTTTLSNTDPAMLNFFIKWLGALGVPRGYLKVHVHLYADMKVEEELGYWSKELGIPLSSFRKPYIKSSNQSNITYKRRFAHGTCNVSYDNRDVSEYVLAAMQYIRETLGDGAQEGGAVY